MKNVLSKKLFREIRSNFKQYLSSVAIAALAVTLLTGLLANHENFAARLGEIYSGSSMCDYEILFKANADKCEDYLKEVGLEYQKRLFLPARVDGHDVYLVSHAKADGMNLPYSSSAERTGESVFIDARFSSVLNVSPGDKLTLYGFSLGDSLPPMIDADGAQIDLALSGTMVHPESLSNSSYTPTVVYVGEEALIKAVSDFLSEKYPFMTPALVRPYLRGAYNEFLIRGEGCAEAVAAIKELYSGSDDLVFALHRSSLPTNAMVETDVDQSKKLMYIFPILFYLVAALIILTSVSQLINRDTKNIGIMKAFGYTTAEITLHYIGIFTVLSLIGGVIGVLLGPLIIPVVMSRKYFLLYQLPDIPLPFFRPEYLVSVVLLVALTVLTGVLSCAGPAGKTPAVSLRGENSASFKKSRLSAFKFYEKVSLPVKMAFRNMRRKFSRTAMVIIGTAGCAALLLSGFGIEDTINFGIDEELTELTPYDVAVSYSAPGSMADYISSLDGVTAVDEYCRYSVTLNGKKSASSYVYVMPDDPKVFDGNLKGDCVLSARAAQNADVAVGDRVNFVYDGKRYEATVSRIEEYCIVQGLFVSESNAIGLPFSPSQAYIKTDSEEKSAAISALLAENDKILSSKTIAEQRLFAQEVMSSIKVMTRTVKAFAVLLAVVVLYNLAQLNFKERVKDIATLKVLGFSRFEIISSFMIEIVALTFFGSIVGLFFGSPLMRAILSINETPLLYYVYHIYLSSYGWTVLATCGSSLAINLLFGFMTDKIKMVESLKAVE